MSEQQVLKTGTTTIGVKYKDGVILASDQRATMSNMIAHSDVQKVHKIADNLGLTIAGVVGDAQLMVRFIQSEVALYSMRKGAPTEERSSQYLFQRSSSTMGQETSRRMVKARRG